MKNHSNSEDRRDLSTRVCTAGSALWIVWYVKACVTFGDAGGTINPVLKRWASSLKCSKTVGGCCSGRPHCLLRGHCFSEVGFVLAAFWIFCSFMGCWQIVGVPQSDSVPVVVLSLLYQAKCAKRSTCLWRALVTLGVQPAGMGAYIVFLHKCSQVNCVLNISSSS